MDERTGPLSFLNDIVPDNLFAASSNNSKMLQVIFFAIFFGIAAISLPKEKTKAVLRSLIRFMILF
ncbi:MAG: cation:dicarboxylase symporter family transporter [Bacteroides graminisolvens]